MYFSILKKKKVSFKLFSMVFLFSMLCLVTTVQAAVPYTYKPSTTVTNTLDITFDYAITSVVDLKKITVSEFKDGSSVALRTPKLIANPTIDAVNSNILHVTIGDLDPTVISYKVKIEKDALDFGGVYTPLTDFILPFSSVDFAYGFKSVFMTNTVSDLNTNIFQYNSPREISIYVPKKYITSVETIHKKDGMVEPNTTVTTSYPKLTNIEVNTDKVVKRLKISVTSSTGAQLVGKELFSSLTGFTTGEAGLDIDTGSEYTISMEAFDVDGKRLENSKYTKKLSDVKSEVVSDYINTKTSKVTDKPISLYDLMKTPATLTSMLQSIDANNLDLIKVMYPNTMDTRFISNSQGQSNDAANVLAKALSDNGVQYIKFDKSLTITPNQTVKLDRPATVGNIVVDGSGSTIIGNVIIGGGAGDNNIYELKNITITGDLTIDLSSSGDCIHTNNVTVKTPGKIIVKGKKTSDVIGVVSTDIKNNILYKIGDPITIGVKFSEQVFVTGNPTLTLNNGVALYEKTSPDGYEVDFKYTVVFGGADFTLGINANPINLNNGIIQAKNGASGGSGLSSSLDLSIPAKLITTATTNQNIVVDPLVPMLQSTIILAPGSKVAPLAPEVISCTANDILDKAFAEKTANWKIIDMGVIPNKTYYPKAVTLNGDNKTVTLVMKDTEFTSSLIITNIKVVMMGDIVDKAGNPVDAMSPIPVLSFTNAIGASVATVRTLHPVLITATFNEALKAVPWIGGTGNNTVLTPRAMTAVAGDLTKTKFIYMWTPDITVVNGNQAFALSAIDLSGNAAITTPLETIKIDNSAPTFSSAFIVNNSVQPNTVTIVADNDLDPTAANIRGNWTITNNAATITYPVASAALQPDNKTVILTLNTVTPGTTLPSTSTFITTAEVAAHIQVTPGVLITDVAGNPYAYAGTVSTTDTGTPIIDIKAPILTPTLTVNNLVSLSVVFSEKVDLLTAQTATNYILSGSSCAAPAQTVLTAILQPDGITVKLTLSAPIDTAEGKILNVTVGGVKDVSGLLQSGTNLVTITN